MAQLTGYERMSNILQRKPVDRIGLYEHFWGDTHKKWTDDGYLQPGENMDDHFGYDMSECWAFNTVADLDFTPVTIEETDDTILVRDGNGALLRRHKQHDTTPEHVDFSVKDRSAWEEQIKPLLTPDPRRINFAGYREAKRNAAAHQRFFMWSGVNVFEMMHPVSGHEYMLMGMADDPEWITDMVDTYANLTIALQEILFAQEGYPDGIWYYEDLGFKERPFMSPAMYQEILKPGHVKTIDFAHSHHMPVTMHSCGFIEPLLPEIVDAGIDCLQVIEVKAGMDPLRIHRQFGDRLSLMGGIDIRVLNTGDHRAIDVELEAKIPILKEGFGFVLHSDHSVPATVPYETYQYFIRTGLELGSY
jgi:uroporphyrinogen decarboxylase